MKVGLRTYLLADAALKAALASATSIHSFPAPIGAVKPYLMITRVVGGLMNTIGESLGVYVESWQIDVMATTDAVAEAIKELVIARLNTADHVEMGSYFVYSCSLTGITDNSDLEMEGSETASIRTTLEFEILRNITPTPAEA